MPFKIASLSGNPTTCSMTFAVKVSIRYVQLASLVPNERGASYNTALIGSPELENSSAKLSEKELKSLSPLYKVLLLKLAVLLMAMLNALLLHLDCVVGCPNTNPVVPTLNLESDVAVAAVPLNEPFPPKKLMAGVNTNSLVLYVPMPAGFMNTEVISPPREPMAPPIAWFLAVPDGALHDIRIASSGICALNWFAEKTAIATVK